jgi:hypothetical protein
VGEIGAMRQLRESKTPGKSSGGSDDNRDYRTNKYQLIEAHSHRTITMNCAILETFMMLPSYTLNTIY